MFQNYTLFQIIRTLWTRIEARKVLEILATQYPQVLQEIVNQHDVLRAPPTKVIEPWVHGLSALVRNGQVISAIKTIRENTGWGLKESKDVLDNMRQGTKSAYCTPTHDQNLKKFPLHIQQAVRKAELQRLGL